MFILVLMLAEIPFLALLILGGKDTLDAISGFMFVSVLFCLVILFSQRRIVNRHQIWSPMAQFSRQLCFMQCGPRALVESELFWQVPVSLTRIFPICKMGTVPKLIFTGSL